MRTRVTLTEETEHAQKIDAILDDLAAHPLAANIRIFGSAITDKAVPGDIDALMEGPYGPNITPDLWREGVTSYLRLAIKGGYSGNYGLFDPFLYNRKNDTLYTRQDGYTQAHWQPAKNATQILAAGRAGIPIHQFTKRYSR